MAKSVRRKSVRRKSVRRKSASKNVPKKAAVYYTEGDKRKGQDGNYYKVIINSKGEKQWKRCGTSKVSCRYSRLIGPLQGGAYKRKSVVKRSARRKSAAKRSARRKSIRRKSKSIRRKSVAKRSVRRKSIRRK